MMFKTTMMIATFCLIAVSAKAADLQGTFTFTKKAPLVALVYFSEDQSGVKTDVIVDQINKEFLKKLVVGPKGTKVIFRNKDIVQHNVFVDDKKQGVEFDSDLVDPNGEVGQVIDWDDHKIVRVGCKIHPRMQLYVGSVSSKYHTVVEFDKKKEVSIDISGAPANLTKVKIWIDRFDPQEVDVAVGATVEVPLTRKGKPLGTLKLTR